MSAAPAYEIRCDCTDCSGCKPHECSVDQFGTCGVAVSDYGNATVVRARLRQGGWKVNLPGGKDRCWDC